MLKNEDFDKFIDENVTIGVPHRVISDKLFFYYGKLEAVDTKHAKLNLKDGQGIRLIPISKILEIRLLGASQ